MFFNINSYFRGDTANKLQSNENESDSEYEIELINLDKISVKIGATISFVSQSKVQPKRPIFSTLHIPLMKSVDNTTVNKNLIKKDI